MKKIFAIAMMAVAAVCGTANAQWYIGGNVGYMHHSTKAEGATNEFAIIPEFGYNINNNWAAGATLGYNCTAYCGHNYNVNLFQFSPYSRYTYYRSSNNLVQLFVDGQVGIGLGWSSASGNDTTLVTWNIGFRPGVAFNFTEKFSVVAHLGLLGYVGANKDAYDAGLPRYGGLNLDSNNLTLGFYYNF